MPALRSFSALLLAALLICAGCSHYQLGTGRPTDLRTLYLEPVGNQTQLPQAQPIVSTQLRQAFLRDGRVRLVNSPGDADAVLRVVITEYGREVAAAREDDTGLARKFNLLLGVTCTLQARNSATAGWANRTLRAQREAFTDGGQLQAEYQALPLLADSIANKVLHATLDQW